jgi:PPOX class probable F420-dependent enzyme
MDLTTATDFARANSQSVLTTIRRNGRPQLSNVVHHVDEDGRIRVSITADRAKYFNLQRDPWAALHVTRPDFWAYVVLEGSVELSPVAAAEDDATVEQLVDYYRSIRGEHPDWDEYRRAQISEKRVLIKLTPEHAYGMA